MGKFVQLYVNGIPIIVFDDFDTIHGSMLERILREVGISDFDVFETSRINGIRIPQPKGEFYEAVGMGRFGFFDNTLTLGDSSGHYGLKPNKDHADKIQSLVTNVRIIIEP